MNTIFASILLVLSLALASVQPTLAKDPSKLSKSAQLLVGKWQNIKCQIMCFSQDGSYSAEPTGVKGRWKLEGNRVVITYSNNSTSTMTLVYLRENELGYERKGDVMPCPRISH